MLTTCLMILPTYDILIAGAGIYRGDFFWNTHGVVPAFDFGLACVCLSIDALVLPTLFLHEYAMVSHVGWF